MDVYDEVDRRETDAGETSNQRHRQVALGCKIHHSHIFLVELFQCGWPLRTTAHWWQTQLWCLSCLSTRNIHPLETRQVLLLSLLQSILSAPLFMHASWPLPVFFFEGSTKTSSVQRSWICHSGHWHPDRRQKTTVGKLLWKSQRWGLSPHLRHCCIVVTSPLHECSSPVWSSKHQHQTRAMSRCPQWITTSSLFPFVLHINCRRLSR